MLLNKDKITGRITWIIFILIAIQMAQALSAFTDVPRKLAEIIRKINKFIFL
jgi:hypothetical protein